MDEQKTIRILKEIFGRYGSGILGDNRRFEATLKDLFGKGFRSPECVVLCHALDSDALLFLAQAPTVTKAAAERTAERLKKECRLRSEDAVFVVRCVVTARGGNVDVLPPSARPRTRAKRSLTILFYVSLISLMGICTAFFYAQRIFYKNLYLSKSAQLGQMEQALTEAKTAASEIQDDRNHLDETLDGVRDKLDEANQTQTEMERKLEEAQRQLSNADAALDAAQEELCKLGRGEYGYASENFHADRGVLTVNPNKTESFSLYGAYESPMTYSMEISDSSGLQADWGEEWDGNFIEVIVTARAPGSYTLKFTNSKNNEIFNVLIVVPDV